MKKRILASLLSAVLAVGLLTACSGESEDSGKTAQDGSGSAVQKEEEELTKVTLNEVAHSIFYAPCMWQLKRGILKKRELNWILSAVLEPTKP